MISSYIIDMGGFKLSVDNPISTWDRERSAVALMSQLFLSRNRQQLVDFLQGLNKNTARKQKANSKVLANMMQKAIEEHNRSEYTNAQEILTKIIRNAPSGSRLYEEALSLRAKTFIVSGRYEQAINDCEIQIQELPLDSEQRLEQFSNLIECYFALGCRKKVQDHLIEFKQIFKERYDKNSKIKLASRTKARCYSTHLKTKDKFEKFMAAMDNNIEQMKYKRTFPSVGDIYAFEPYEGFNPDPEIRHSSAACSLVIKNSKPTIFSNRFIPKGQIVIAEDPYLWQQTGPPLHCDTCFTPCRTSYSCLGCHFKHYCSYECKNADKMIHDIECIGYKILLIPFLKSELVFRLLIKYLFLLKQYVFYRQKMCRSETAAELYDNFRDIVSSMPYELLDDEEVNLQRFSDCDFEHMIVNSYFLTIFISEQTTLMQNFLSDLNADPHELEVFLSALLLRLHAKVLAKSLEMKIRNPFDCESSILKHSQVQLNHTFLMETKKTASEPHKGKNMFEYFGFDIKSMKKDAHSKVQEIFEKYWKNLETPKTSNASENVITSESYIPMEASAIVNSLLDISSCDSESLGVIGLFSTTTKLHHSCDPNVKMIYLSCGKVIVKAIRDIESGEHITLSYGCHYKQEDNRARLSLTRKLDILCPCDYCHGKFNPWFGDNVLCNNCKCLVSPSEKFCVICGFDMDKTRHLYRRLMLDLEFHLPENNSKQMFYKLMFSIMVYENILPSTHQMYVGKLVQLVRLLVKKHFVYECYILLKAIRDNLDKIYVEMCVKLLHAYDTLVNPLIEILLILINDSKGIPGKFIDTIYNFTIDTIETMIEMNDFNVLYDSFTLEILKKYHFVLNLKEKIYSIPLRSTLYKNVINVIRKPKNRTPIMSPLTEVVKSKDSSDDKENSPNSMNTPQLLKNFNDLKFSENSSKCVDVDKQKITEMKATTETSQYSSEPVKVNRESMIDVFIDECDKYFMKMIEERMAAADVYMPS